MALLEAKESLQRMLRDYVKDMPFGGTSETLQKAVVSLDVAIISTQYEAEMKKPISSLVNGDLLRMLMIQLQFMKKELWE